MFIIFGTRGIKHTVDSSPVLKNKCPNCSNGDLVHKLYRRWFTLFFIPVIPLDVVDRFYQCNNCKSAYNEGIKNILQQSQQDQDAARQEAELVFCRALIASMSHMTMIDGDIAPEEEREIDDAIAQFPNYTQELNSIKESILKYGNKENQVFEYLYEAKNILSSEGVIRLLAQAGVVLLADGNIDKEEETLMKEYLIACGLPKEMYQALIDKLTQKSLTTLSDDQLN
jgi:tellurite resistance protein